MTRTYTVPILLPADPVNALEAATKQYVDTSSGGGVSNNVSYTYNTTTTAPPASAGMRLNNATLASATTMWLHQVTLDGTDVTLGLSRITAGWQIYIQTLGNSANWRLYDVTSTPTDSGAYWTIPVANNSGGGTIAAGSIALQSISPAEVGLPRGGADGDVLTKTSGSDFAVAWETPGSSSASGTKLSALTALTGAGGATGDLIEVVDVSDTTMAGSGTNKKMTLAEAVIFLGANGVVPNARTITATAPVTIAGTTSADLSANRTVALAVDGVTNTYLAQMPTLTVKGNSTGSTAGPTDLTVATLRTMLGIAYQEVFSVPGTLTVTVGKLRYYFNRTVTISNVRASVDTAPTGATILVDVNKNGTTIFTTQGNRPTIAISGNTDTSNVPDVTSFASGDYMTVDVDQIGSTIAGADLTVQVEYV